MPLTLKVIILLTLMSLLPSCSGGTTASTQEKSLPSTDVGPGDKGGTNEGGTNEGGTDESGLTPDLGSDIAGTPNTWTDFSLSGSPWKEKMTAVWTGSKVLQWGGGYSDWSADYLYNEGNIYDPANDSWTPMSTVGAPSGRFGHSAVWTGSKMIVWGGTTNTYSGDSNFLNTGGIYDPDTDEWSPTSTINAPTARAFHEAIWADGKMIVIGGRNGAATHWTGQVSQLEASWVADIKAYDPETDTWTDIATAQNLRDSQLSLTNDSIFWWKGSTLLRFDLASNNITEITPSSGTGKARSDTPSTAFVGGKLLVAGGFVRGTGYVTSTVVYNSATNSWEQTTGPAPGSLSRAVAIGPGRAFIWGGDLASSLFTASNNTFSSVPTHASECPANGAGAVPVPNVIWTGQRVLVLCAGGTNAAFTPPSE